MKHKNWPSIERRVYINKIASISVAELSGFKQRRLEASRKFRSTLSLGDKKWYTDQNTERQRKRVNTDAFRQKECARAKANREKAKVEKERLSIEREEELAEDLANAEILADPRAEFYDDPADAIEAVQHLIEEELNNENRFVNWAIFLVRQARFMLNCMIRIV